MKTEHELALALKTMMAEVPLDDISVTALTKRCHVNRKTFYYHFHDIFDLLTQVFLDEKIEGTENTKDINQLMKVIFSYYSKNSKFIDATLDSAGKELVQEFFYNICYTNFLRYILATQDGKKVHINDRKYIARFYAFAYSNSIIYFTTKIFLLEAENTQFAMFQKNTGMKDLLFKKLKSTILIRDGAE